MFSKVLQQLRKNAKLTQEQISDMLQVPKRTYGSWERDERQPDLETLAKIADFFNVSTDYLLGRVPMDVVVKHETPPPQGDDVIQLQFHLDDAPKDEESMEAAIRRIVTEEFEKRGL